MFFFFFLKKKQEKEIDEVYIEKEGKKQSLIMSYSLSLLHPPLALDKRILFLLVSALGKASFADSLQQQGLVETFI